MKQKFHSFSSTCENLKKIHKNSQTAYSPAQSQQKDSKFECHAFTYTADETNLHSLPEKMTVNDNS